LLKQLEIKSLIYLPGVGENHQEHIFSSLQFELQPGHLTFDAVRNNATFAAEQIALYNKTGGGIFGAADATLAFFPLSSFLNQSSISSLNQLFDSVAQQASPTELSKLQYPIQRDWVDTNSVPHIEIILWTKGVANLAANQSYVTLLTGLQHPTSRGTVHINSTDPLAAPVIDPRFLSNDFDSNSLLEAVKFAQRITRSSPLAGDIVNGTTSSDSELLNQIRENCSPGGHPIGTAAMAPRENGGVVDSKLKVYGTKNLRIVDASVVPLHFAAHLQSTVYAIAEKAAEMIKESKRED